MGKTMSGNINIRNEGALAKELATKVRNFPWGGFAREGSMGALYILEFQKLANRFIEIARRLGVNEGDQQIVPLNATSPGEATELYQQLQPLADLIDAIDVEELIRSRARACDDLRVRLSKIGDANTQAFVEEAVTCFENDLHRSAVVMSWLAAVHVLYRHVLASCLKEFNAEAIRVDSKWKLATTIDDMGRMKERDFLDRLAALSVIGRNVKQELVKCLELRNACGHPNSYQLARNTVAHHIETLLMNVFEVFG